MDRWPLVSDTWTWLPGMDRRIGAGAARVPRRPTCWGFYAPTPQTSPPHPGGERGVGQLGFQRQTRGGHRPPAKMAERSGIVGNVVRRCGPAEHPGALGRQLVWGRPPWVNPCPSSQSCILLSRPPRSEGPERGGAVYAGTPTPGAPSSEPLLGWLPRGAPLSFPVCSPLPVDGASCGPTGVRPVAESCSLSKWNRCQSEETRCFPCASVCRERRRR